MSGPYGYSAADSVTGAIYQWTLASVDFSGTGYPGPNAPVNQRLVTTNALDALSNTTPLLMVFTNATTRRAQSLTVADLGRRGLQLDTAKIWDVVPSLASPGTYVWGDNAGPEVSSVDLSSFFTPGTVLQSVQSDRGITTGGTFTWLDQSGNGKHYTQATALKQPTLTTGLNGNPGVLFTQDVGTPTNSDLITSALNLPAPGTTPTWIGVVWRNIIASANGRPLCDTSTGISQIVYEATTDAKLTMFNGGVGPLDSSPPALNTWECSEFYFSGSTSDYMRRGSNAATTTPGSNAGNGTGTGRNIGGCDAIFNYSTVEVLHVIYVNSKQPTAIANWRAAMAAQYGAGNVLA